jgi:chromosome segregation ATPase
MKLAKVTENILAKDSGAPLRERIAELEKERGVLRLALDHSAEDYELFVAGSRKLSSERDQLKIRCDNLQAELAQAHSDAEKRISDLEAKVASIEVRNIEIATEGEKSLRDFQGVLVRQLERVHDMYAKRVQSIEGLCLMMPAEDPSVEDYLNWLSEEVSGLPDVFSGVNENFATAAIEGALALVGDSIDLEAVWTTASEAGVDILPAALGVRKATRAVSKKWWQSFGYDYVLSAIRTQEAEVKVLYYSWVLVCFRLLTLVIDLF